MKGKIKKQINICKVFICGKKRFFRRPSLCRKHYYIYLRKLRKINNVLCNIVGCEKILFRHKLCRMHLDRLEKFGDVGIVGEKIRSKGEGSINTKGYKVITINKKEVKKHRYVMELYLGRKLNIWEQIHHINENKLDNRIENLMIVSANEHAKIHGLGL